MPLTARYAAAQQVALKAGEIARDLFAKRDSLIVEHKGAQNFVSRAARAVEDFIASKLKAAFPNDAFLGEERPIGAAGIRHPRERHRRAAHPVEVVGNAELAEETRVRADR